MIRYFLLFFLIAIWSGESSAYYKIILIGTNGNSAPSRKETFESNLRNHLLSTPKVQVEDALQSQRYQRMADFSLSSVSTQKFNTITKISSDSVLFVWASIKKYDIIPQRKRLLWGKLETQMTVSLNIYNPYCQKFLESGDIDVSLEKPAGFIMFHPVSKAIHVSAIQRAEILDELEDLAIQECGKKIVSALDNGCHEENDSTKNSSDTGKQSLGNDEFDELLADSVELIGNEKIEEKPLE
ncbi:MAG: hypothetical protein Q4F84_05585 [Fibrobacter sp.]|nr:hypothetical protein [Fibrobacter sp.]